MAGLGVAGADGYAVFKELIFQPKEYKVFDKALKRIQDDSQVRVRIGSPIKGYGQETRNRAARQRIPNRVFTDEDGVEHVEVNFYIRGPQGAGKDASSALYSLCSVKENKIRAVESGIMTPLVELMADFESNMVVNQSWSFVNTEEETIHLFSLKKESVSLG